MNLRKKLAEERGQGLIEYTPHCVLCCLSALAWREEYQRRRRAHESLEHNYRLCRQPFFL